tara:strand:- start:157 stop:594 length:438 start_codon:yes stop_codon:yes gene_type:complete
MGWTDSAKRFGMKVGRAIDNGVQFGKKVAKQVVNIGTKVSSGAKQVGAMADALGLADTKIRGQSIGNIASRISQSADAVGEVGKGIGRVSRRAGQVKRIGGSIVQDGVMNPKNIQRAMDIKRYADIGVGAGRRAVAESRNLIQRR